MISKNNMEIIELKNLKKRNIKNLLDELDNKVEITEN